MLTQSKQDRLNKIRARYMVRFGVALVGFIPTARAAIRQETAQITSTARAEMNDAITDEETDGFVSTLPFDSVNRVEPRDSDSDSILTPAERKKLAREYYNHLDKLTRPASLATS